MIFELTPGTVLTGVFTIIIIFNLLKRTKFFGTDRVAGLLSIVFGFFAMMYQPLVEIMEQMIPIAVMIFIFLFIALFMIDLFNKASGKDMLPTIAGLIIVLLVAMVYQHELASFFPVVFGYSQNIVWLLGLTLVALILYFAYTHHQKTIKLD